MKNTAEIWDVLAQVYDPEIPVLSVVDMGVVRQVELRDTSVVVTITPTYSGCPAMHTIEQDIAEALEERGYTVDVKTVLSPAWTTDWLTEKGRKALREYGIVPPVESTSDKRSLLLDEVEVPCPQCGSKATKLVSEFGSTACKALYACIDCKEPFDYFKCL